MVKKDILRVLQSLKPEDKVRLAEYLGLNFNRSKQPEPQGLQSRSPKEKGDK